MKMAAHISMSAWTLRDLVDLPGRLGRWWLAELLALFPQHSAEWLMGEGPRRLVVLADQDAVEMRLLTDRHRMLGVTSLPLASYTAEAIDVFLRSHNVDRSGVSVGLWLAPEKLFRRTLLLPPETIRSLDRVVEQDLLIKTPFRLDGIYHGYLTSRAAGSPHVRVQHWIVRRDIVRDAATSLGMDADKLNFVESEPDEAGLVPVIPLYQDRKTRKTTVRKLAWSLALSALLLGIVACGITYWRQQSLLDDLEDQIAAARAKAQLVRSTVDKLEARRQIVLQLRSRKEGVAGLLDTWEEATRALPTHSWLTELRFSEEPNRRDHQIAMTGFSTAAASLVGLFDQSGLFADASLTAPVTLDPIEGRERFALQAHVTSAPLRSASR
jgi:general secretion pathway protein L